MKEVSIFIVTSTRSPGKTRKAWYRYILVCEGASREKKVQVTSTTGHRASREKKVQVTSTTGHRLVLECVVAALKRMTRPAMITFWTDCHYFANGQRRLAVWKENGWKRPDGKEVRNLDLWQQIEELLRPHAVSFRVENMERCNDHFLDRLPLFCQWSETACGLERKWLETA